MSVYNSWFITSTSTAPTCTWSKHLLFTAEQPLYLFINLRSSAHSLFVPLSITEGFWVRLLPGCSGSFGQRKAYWGQTSQPLVCCFVSC